MKTILKNLNTELTSLMDVYSNLEWDQYRWGSRNVFYYINDNGEFVVRLNQEYVYPEDAKV